jgi:mannose-6-phosphate isomerase
MSSPLEPVRLRPDNFTPVARTPWGGRRIRAAYKAQLDLPTGDPVVGESWEISVEPSFPSRAASGDALLADLIAGDPEGWLGSSVATRYAGQTPLLVKLIDAAEALSVQVHPADGDPALGIGESGKPEAWVILDREPGAGLFLGFREGVRRRDVEACLQESRALDELMNFVPVERGDAFVIGAGTPHAIGGGVTLIEPQFVMPGRRGLTYRFWDWNRLYDASGQPSATGAPRELHVERSLAVTRWESPSGVSFVDACRSRQRVLEAGGSAEASAEPNLERVLLIDWPWFRFEQWAGSGALRAGEPRTMTGVVCVEGELRIEGSTGELRLRGGESGVLPAGAGSLTAWGRDVLAFAVASPLR